MPAAKFCLLLDPMKPEAELWAECALCGTITTLPLDAAWLARTVPCSECATAMPLDAGTLDVLGRQADAAQEMVAQLLAKGR